MRFSKIFNLIMSASSVYARYMTRLTQPTISLYSPSGRHLKISESGRVSSTPYVGHPLAALKLVVVADNEFYIQGVWTGRYIAEAGRGRLQAVMEQSRATRFSEAHLENFFNEYHLTRDEKCSLSIRKRGAVRVECHNKSTDTHLLPRRTHKRMEKVYNY